MGKYFRVKNKKDLMMTLLTAVLFIFLAVYSFYSITFILRRINDAVSMDSINGGEIIRFNFTLLEQLKKK